MPQGGHINPKVDFVCRMNPSQDRQQANKTAAPELYHRERLTDSGFDKPFFGSLLVYCKESFHMFRPKF
jgi:hypothetical protein